MPGRPSVRFAGVVVASPAHISFFLFLFVERSSSFLLLVCRLFLLESFFPRERERERAREMDVELSQTGFVGVFLHLILPEPFSSRCRNVMPLDVTISLDSAVRGGRVDSRLRVRGMLQHERKSRNLGQTTRVYRKPKLNSAQHLAASS